MKQNHCTLFFLGLMIVTLPLFGAACTKRSVEEEALFKPVTINYWRVFDESDSLSDAISAYEALHPNVTVNYRMLRYEEYERELLQGFAEDRGPDVFSIHNTWIDKYRRQLASFPAKTLVGFVVEKGFNKRRVEEVREISLPTGADIRAQYVDVVSQDVIRSGEKGEELLGLPLALDTLALFYNKDLLNNAGLLHPPKDWEEFKDAISKIAKRNSSDDQTLDQAGAALGTADNIQRSFDILSTIMMQNGAQMTRGSKIAFDSMPDGYAAGTVIPGVDAVRFYTDFAYSGKEGIYTWNETMPDSMEAFMQGRTAMVFGYSYHAQQIRAKAPQVQFGVVQIPQIDPNRPATAANYWIEGVSKKAMSQAYAWDFINFLAQEKQVETYLQKTGKPSALRSLALQQMQDETLSPFATQVPFAKNWYHGRNPGLAETAFTDMINESLQKKGGRLEEERSRLTGIVSRARARIESDY